MKNSLHCLLAALAALAMFWVMLAIANIGGATQSAPVLVPGWDTYHDCSQGCGMGYQDRK